MLYKKNCTIGFAVLFLVAFFINKPALSETLLLSGSSTVQKRILEPASEAIHKATGVWIDVQGINSGRGFDQLVKGKVTASIASSPLSLLLEKASLPNDGLYREHIIAQDVIVPIVHKTNPVSTLSWKQLSDIHTGTIRNWREVGGLDLRITVITSKPTSATRKVFQNIIMEKTAYTKHVREVKSSRQEVNLVAKFKGGIGAVSEGFVLMYPDRVKTIQTNPISRPLSVITRGEPTPKVQKVLDFLLSSQARRTFK